MKVRVIISDCGKYYMVQKKKLFGWNTETYISSLNYLHTDNKEEAIAYAKRLLNKESVFEGEN